MAKFRRVCGGMSMSDIEKASRAVGQVLVLLIDDKKLNAVRLMEMAYQCSKQEAIVFVEVVEYAYDLGN